MNNRELATKIYQQLNIRGAELGNASINIIADVLDEYEMAVLTEARRRFEIIANTETEEGWVQVAPQFAQTFLDMYPKAPIGAK